jgi:predicted nuclease of predicted toxin-antitoxin system
MKFLADMGVSMHTVKWLRGKGFNTTHVREEGMLRAPDSEIAKKAFRENRIILTFDLDFAAILALSRFNGPSTIIFRLSNALPQNINFHLLRVITNEAVGLEKGVIISVEDGKYRVRSLPIK